MRGLQASHPGISQNQLLAKLVLSQPSGTAGRKEVRAAQDELAREAEAEVAAKAREAKAEAEVAANDAKRARIVAVVAMARASMPAEPAAKEAVVAEAPAAQTKGRTVVRPPHEMEERLRRNAEAAGCKLDLAALREAKEKRDGDDGHAPSLPLKPGEDEAGQANDAWVEYKPPVSDYVDRGTFAAYHKSTSNGGSSSFSQHYSATKQGADPALQMAQELMGNMGDDLWGLYPQLDGAQVIPVMGHRETHASPASVTYKLADALGFGTVNASILTHRPGRLAVKEFPTAAERVDQLKNRYSADLSSAQHSDDDEPLDIVVVDDSSSHGCTTNEIARTIKEEAAAKGLRVKVWVVVLAQGVRHDECDALSSSPLWLNHHLPEEIHREIERAVDTSATDQPAAAGKEPAGRFRGGLYAKWATDATGNVVGGYGGSSFRPSYVGKPFEKIVQIRDREHEAQLRNGTHHCWRLQRLKKKEGHQVSEAQLFREIESEEGEGWDTFVRRGIALEQELIDALNWYGIMLNTSDVTGRPSEASSRRGGQHSQQRVQLIFKLENGGSTCLSLGKRLARLPGDRMPALTSAKKQADGSLHVSFACGSDEVDVTPPAGWDGQDPKVQRASVEAARTGGRHSQQRVHFVWRLRNGGSLLSTTIGCLDKLQGHVEPAIAGTGQKQQDGTVRLSFACGSSPIDVTPPPDWNRQRPTVQRAIVEAQHVNLHNGLFIAGGWYIPDAPAMLAMRAQLTLPGNLDNAVARSRLAALTTAATIRVKGNAVSTPTDKGMRHAA